MHGIKESPDSLTQPTTDVRAAWKRCYHVVMWRQHYRGGGNKICPRDTSLTQRWASVEDGGPALGQ